MVRRRGRRKRAIGTRTPMLLPHAINQRWSLDFVSDTLSDGRRFRILCVVDDFSRECLATVVDTSLGGVRVVRGHGARVSAGSSSGTENTIAQSGLERRVCQPSSVGATVSPN